MLNMEMIYQLVYQFFQTPSYISVIFGNMIRLHNYWASIDLHIIEFNYSLFYNFTLKINNRKKWIKLFFLSLC